MSERQLVEYCVTEPPQDIKDFIDRTVSHFSEKGYKLMDYPSLKDNPNLKDKAILSFLSEDDPFHAYFMQKIKICEGGKELVPVGKEKFKIVEKPKNPPPEFEFAVDPPSILAYELEVIQLTALYVARNGRPTQNNLASKQSRDFDFLRPQHSHHVYFNKLVEQYMKILQPSRIMLLNLDEGINDPDKFSNDARYRVDWIRYEQSSKSNEEDEKEKEKLAYKQIDWSFDDPNMVDLFITTSYEPFVKRENLGSWCIEQIMGQSNSVKKIRIVEDSIRGADTEIQDMEEENDAEEFTLPPLPKRSQGDKIIVARNYDPKAKKLVEPNQNVFASPLTNEIVSENNLPNHIRINLLNPNWLADRDRSDTERQRQEDVYARGDDIKKNLNDMSQKRTDLFRVSEETPNGGKTEKKENAKPIWDGHSASVGKIQQSRKVPIEEQIADIHKNNGLIQDESKEKIGPSKPANVFIPNQNYNSQIPSMRPPPVPAQLPPMYHQPMMAPNAMPMATLPSYSPGLKGYMHMVHPGPEFNAEDEPLAKKSKQENGLIPENEFLASHPYPVTFKIQVPNVENSTLCGQFIPVELPVSDQVSVLKAKICSAIGMPTGKQKLQIGSVFLKDGNTLAYYNIDNNTVVSLQTKERGGRKK